jgi:glycyl-tRNA synthetase beta chain
MKKTKTNSNAKINALLEIGLEEVPARFMPAILADLKQKAEKELQASRLSFGSIETYGTPRRIVLYLEGLPNKQDDLTKEVRGPHKQVAFADNGTPTKAGEGFAKGQGVAVSDLQVRKVGDKEFVFASVREKGIETDKLLESLFPKLIKSLYLPISMRWGSVDFKFIRPLHWLVALCGKKILSFEISGIRSSNKTFGHRFLGGKPIIINTAKGIDIKGFKAALLKGRVMLDQNERKAKISDMVKEMAKKLGGSALIEGGILDEVNYLVEWPVPLSGGFKKEYLSLPKDVLVTVMKKHQKYVSVFDSAGRILPLFVNITNGVKKEDLKNVQEGNERVLSARLYDAKFFFDEDRKKSLEDLVPKLEKVAFYDKLGSISEKVERIVALSDWIAKELKLAQSQRDDIKHIAQLCKADLMTQMVYELPELQGVMGREYSLLEGKPKEIANGIFEHYLPRHSEDIMPSSIEGAVVGIADKIDSIVGCFSINLIPTGSEDPFALRRQAQGIVSVLMNKKINLELDDLIGKAYKLYEPLFLGELFTSGNVKYNDVQKVTSDVLAFIAARVRSVLLESGTKYDVADAVLSHFADVQDVCEKGKVLSRRLKEEWFKGVVFTADRISRLAVNAARENVVEADFVQEEERALYALYLEVNSAIGEAINRNDYETALKELSKFTKPVEDFFVKVMVMDKNEKVKANRLALLKTLERMYLEIADLPKIVM